MDRKINNLDAKLQTLKIENKIEEIKEKQEMDHIIPLNQKMININNNYNIHENEINEKEKEKMREIIKEFRTTFYLGGECSDKKIVDALKEYKFNFIESFESLFD